MAAPSAVGATGSAADSDHLAGALAVTWTVMAFGEIVRPIRLLNIPIGGWLAVAPWLLAGAAHLSRWNDTIVGIGLIMLRLPRGRIEERFGAWHRYLT